MDLDFFMKIIGSLAGVFNVITFVPQVYKTWKMKTAEDVSMQMFVISTINASMWTFYGIALVEPDGRIYIPNALVTILSIAQIVLKVKYDRANKK
ncbi:hypothetical protein AGMMS49592_3060 [Endomicrobiia bacterium]|nr:hypothetical protein AGMMS49592_3060 [Endomicrobiia bacterium]GHT50623.1 hypothetical protein AGMMS49990_03340 [Endomicrobiia bacterium]GHT56142.1 hypothetical protein AGMMS50233_07320 [Endomicrobiia bacterium]